LSPKTVLVVEDRANTLKVIAAILADEGYDVLTATSGADALETFRRHETVHAVLSDMKMPEMDGMELFRQLRAVRTPPPFVMMTAYGTVKSAVDALKEGVANYLIKPLDYDELLIILAKVIREHEMSEELAALKARIGHGDSFHDLIGSHPKMQAIFRMIRTVGPTDVSVLIYGETGSGKELIARALHRESQRRGEVMVCINSAALSESLLEAELFGYVRGAFTGAVSDRKGRLEMAHKGTLFLDEIGHMSLNLQAKLLRFLQEMTFEPVGGTTSCCVDVRVIAATNVDLQAEIEKGRFLSDLLYRLEVVPMWVPALRQRKEDICLLSDHFIRKFSLEYDRQVRGLTPEAMNLLTDYPWPGNVRELENCIAHAMILSRGDRLAVEDLPKKIVDTAGRESHTAYAGLIGELPEKGATLREMEMQLIEKTLVSCRGNKSLAAQRLGISRKTLYEKIQRYGIRI
jgi:DNA-binding NtrC family response regulator